MEISTYNVFNIQLTVATSCEYSRTLTEKRILAVRVNSVGFCAFCKMVDRNGGLFGHHVILQEYFFDVFPQATKRTTRETQRAGLHVTKSQYLCIKFNQTCLGVHIKQKCFSGDCIRSKTGRNI